MSFTRVVRRAGLAAAVALRVVAAASPATAQVGAVSPAGAACDFTRCGLGLLPRLTGLDVVRGADETPVASLGFLRAGDVRPAFAGDTAAVRHAVMAMRLRRAGAALTTLGIAGAAAAVWRGALSHDRAGSAAFAAAGATLFAVSVPVQFAADAELSRAVWIYNRRFTR